MSTTTNTKAENVHLVGFSLGAHVAGLTANNVKSGKIRHITGRFQGGGGGLVIQITIINK